jgi:hypothetical protein
MLTIFISSSNLQVMKQESLFSVISQKILILTMKMLLAITTENAGRKIVE